MMLQPQHVVISVALVLKHRVGHLCVRAGRAVGTSHPEFRSGVLGVLVSHHA